VKLFSNFTHHHNPYLNNTKCFLSNPLPLQGLHVNGQGPSETYLIQTGLSMYELLVSVNYRASLLSSHSMSANPEKIIIILVLSSLMSQRPQYSSLQQVLLQTNCSLDDLQVGWQLLLPSLHLFHSNFLVMLQHVGLLYYTALYSIASGFKTFKTASYII